MERITSRNNALVKRFRDLAHTADTAASGELLLDGAHLVQEALACAIPIELAAFSDRQLASARAPLAQVAAEVRRQGGRVLGVTDQVLAAMSPVESPSGVVAIARAQKATIEDIFAKTKSAAGVNPPLVVVLAGLQDPGNVGAIVRTAAACGATGVAAIEGSANPFGWKALRGAMGGTFRLPVASRVSLQDVMASARREDVTLIAAVPRGGTPLPRLDLRRPTAIILGSEGGGVSQTAVSAATELVTIPMRRPIESLNVAVAAAVILYEASRQRQEVET
jgi:RNA methyltransferase, TrmH family